MGGRGRSVHQICQRFSWCPFFAGTTERDTRSHTGASGLSLSAQRTQVSHSRSPSDQHPAEGARGAPTRSGRRGDTRASHKIGGNCLASTSPLHPHGIRAQLHRRSLVDTASKADVITSLAPTARPLCTRVVQLPRLCVTNERRSTRLGCGGHHVRLDVGPRLLVPQSRHASAQARRTQHHLRRRSVRRLAPHRHAQGHAREHAQQQSKRMRRAVAGAMQPASHCPQTGDDLRTAMAGRSPSLPYLCALLVCFPQ